MSERGNAIIEALNARAMLAKANGMEGKAVRMTEEDARSIIEADGVFGRDFPGLSDTRIAGYPLEVKPDGEPELIVSLGVPQDNAGNPLADRRVGRVVLSFSALENATPKQTQLIQEALLVVEASHEPVNGDLRVTAASKHFRPILIGEEIPHYRMTFCEGTHDCPGEVVFREER